MTVTMTLPASLSITESLSGKSWHNVTPAQFNTCFYYLNTRKTLKLWLK